MWLIDELRRRHVFCAALAYLAAAWLLIQVLETPLPIFGLPETSIRIVVVLLATGFIPAVVLAWVFEWTPEGFKRDSEVTEPAAPVVSRRLDRAIIVLLALAVTFLVVDEFVFDAAPPSDRLVSIAVLAFEDLSPARDQEWFAEGLSEELLNLLGGIPELRVAARTSAFSFKDSDATIVEIADALDVDHVVEGSCAASRTASALPCSCSMRGPTRISGRRTMTASSGISSTFRTRSPDRWSTSCS